MTVASPDEILSVLDQAARDFTFPMLDNGYVYLAASRLSILASPFDWAVVFEIFGFSPRAGFPDLLVSAFTSRPSTDRTVGDFVREEAYRNHLRFNANLEQTTFYPIEDEDWIDPEDSERVNRAASTLQLRGEVGVPNQADYAAAGIVESARFRIDPRSRLPEARFCARD